MDREPGHAFPLLESLSLQNLINLEMIFKGQFTVESFCNLKFIKVEKCDKLKNDFSFSIARGLPQLQTLEVIECSNMEMIFFPRNEDGIEEIYATESKDDFEDIYDDDSEDDINNNEVIDKIAIVCIRSLTLKSLPILRSSCLKVTWSDKVVLEDELDSNIPLFGERVGDVGTG
ncbi:uncharacterized protein LOC116107402 isoform X2 [Pistacia vera]|uniref:uncharacterized protein LOC116107402 isoform X2 n=1 Tax=Pistacia vera TaxID=55513 RepID=UPI001263D7C3|nr:uncharacterized protein LOC116107402 isoform X2 [Pistacia vera]